MRALTYDGEPRLSPTHPEPTLRPGWAIIAVRLAGICRTDLEIVRGYMGFRGILGHEFVGDVVECGEAAWLGRRVVGEINAACGVCRVCGAGLPRHCPHRTVLGIQGLDGCLADRCALPIANLHRVPDRLGDTQAVFTEPLAAAYQILDQVAISPGDRCVVLGDGKLGILCAWVLCTTGAEVMLVGHHDSKLERAQRSGVSVAKHAQGLAGADVVVEATGSPKGLADAMAICRPRGTIVLKSTIAADAGMNLAPIVVNEVTVVGSRCGPFDKALHGLSTHSFAVDRLITATYRLDQAVEALEAAGRRGALKVLIQP